MKLCYKIFFALQLSNKVLILPLVPPLGGPKISRKRIKLRAVSLP